MTDKWIEMVMNDTNKCRVVLLTYLSMSGYSNMEIATMTFQGLIVCDHSENY